MATGTKTVAHTGIYTLGNLLRNMVSFIMLPVYTRYLTPADYGTVELLTMLIDIAGLVFGMRLGDAIFRFYMTAQSDAERKQVIATAMGLAAGLNTIGVLIIMVAAPLVSVLLFGMAGHTRYVLLFAMTLLMQGLIEIGMIHIRARQLPWLFISVSIVRLSLQLGFNIYFIVARQMHVEGVIYSALAANGIVAAVLAIYTLSQAGAHFSRKHAGTMLRYSAPLVLAAVGTFYLGFGDRYFLRVFTDVSTVGIYALGYKFGFVLLYLTWDPFYKIWEAQRYEVYRLENAREIYQRTFLAVSAVTVTAALGIAVYVDDLLRVMSAPEYWPAASIVPVVLAAYVVHGWAGFSSFGALLHSRTMLITWSTWISVAVITAGYVGLIPFFGAAGAAWATLIAFLVRLYWIHEKSRTLYDMELPWGRVALLSAVAVAFYLLSLAAPAGLLGGLLVKSVLMAGFLLLLFRLPIFTPEERHRLLMMARSRAPWRRAPAAATEQEG